MYKRIAGLRKEVLNSLEGLNDDENLMLLDSIDNFFECETYKKYEFVLNFCKKNGFNRIFDIGCAYGLQSEVFLDTKVDYVGVDEWKGLEFWNEKQFKYIVGHYPFKVNTNDNDLAVSSLCLGWNCYLHEGEKTLIEQCEALQRDFKQCLLYIPKDKIECIGRYFEKVEMFDNGFVFFSNK